MALRTVPVHELAIKALRCPEGKARVVYHIDGHGNEGLALAAQYGARKDSTRAAIVGCGTQAKYQLETMRSVFALRTIRVRDIDKTRAEAFAAAHSMQDCTVAPAPRISAAIAGVDICITCTTSKSSVPTSSQKP